MSHVGKRRPPRRAYFLLPLLALHCGPVAPPAPPPVEVAAEAEESSLAGAPTTVAIVQASRDPWTERASRGLVRRLRSQGMLVMSESPTRRAIERHGLDPMLDPKPEDWMRAFAADAVAILVPGQASLENIGVDTRCSLEAELRLVDLRRGRTMPPARAHATARASADDGYDALEHPEALLHALTELSCGAAADTLGARLRDELGWTAKAERTVPPRPAMIRMRGLDSSAAWGTVVVEIEAEAGLEARAAITGIPATHFRDSPPVELAAARLEETGKGQYRATLRLPPRSRPDGRVRAERWDRFGVLSQSSSGALSMPVDPEPPEPPVDLAAQQIDDPPGVILDWQPASVREPDLAEADRRYRVYRSTEMPPRFERIGEATAPAYLDPTRSTLRRERQDRFYAVVSVDGAGNPSPPSALLAIRAGSLDASARELLPRIPWRRDPDRPRRDTLGTAVLTVGDGETAARRTVTLDHLRIDIATARLRDVDALSAEILVVTVGSEGMETHLHGDLDASWPLVETGPGVYIAAIPLATRLAPDSLVVEMKGPSGARIRRDVSLGP